jgi:hypothetical protein
MEGTISKINMSTTARTVRWNGLPALSEASEATYFKMIEHKGVLIRVATLPAGYNRSHDWKQGQVVYCLQGELIVNFSQEDEVKIFAEMSFIVDVHRQSGVVQSSEGATILILDVSALKKTDDMRNPWKM